MRLLVLDFDGVLTDNAVWVFEDGREAVRCTRADGIGLSRLRRTGVEALIASSEVNPVVSARAKKLRLPCRQGLRDKPAAVEQVLAERGLSWAEVAFLGNDVNDRACLERAGLPAVVADAEAAVLPLAAYVTRRRGGHGAVREFCDLLAEAREQAGLVEETA